MEHLIRVQNEYDRQILVWLRGRIGDAALASAARRAAAEGKKPYLSTICRLLKIRPPTRRMFAEEARKIHYGERESRNIYGRATEQEANELRDEGIEFGEIPWRTRSDA